jgi:branched-chain amino acid transport system permease protein
MIGATTSNLDPKVGLSLRDPRFCVLAFGFLLIAVIPLISVMTGDRYLTFLVTKMIVFAIAAVGLDLILGYGGMVSFGHAAYLGLGCYAVAVWAKYAFDFGQDWMYSGVLQFGSAIVLSALFAFLVGLLSLRTSGLYFIMITLAFTQMLYFLGISLEPFGGDDGMNTEKRSDFHIFSLGDRVVDGGIGHDNIILFYFSLISLIVIVVLLRRFVNARFGFVIRGAYSNETRMRAIGFPVFRYRLISFTIAGAICGWAGALYANLTEFLTPQYMTWIQSGEFMVMVIMGGMGTIFGPILGAIAFVGIEEILKDIARAAFGGDNEGRWRLFFGPMLLLLVLFARRGIFGLIPAIWSFGGAKKPGTGKSDTGKPAAKTPEESAE